jgi:hypothetical protein
MPEEMEMKVQQRDRDRGYFKDEHKKESVPYLKMGGRRGFEPRTR